MTLDNDTNTNAPPPSAGVPSADSAAASSPPGAAPPSETKEQRKARLAADRQARHRERKAGRDAGFAIPRRAPSGPRVHRTAASRPDFARFNAGASYAAPSSTANPADVFREGALVSPKTAPAPATPALTEADVAPYAGAVAVWVAAGFLALTEKMPEEERKYVLGNIEPVLRQFVHGATTRICIKYGLAIPYFDEAVVATCIGSATFALFWGKKGEGIPAAIKHVGVAAGALMSGKSLADAPAAPSSSGSGGSEAPPDEEANNKPDEADGDAGRHADADGEWT